MNDIIRLEQVLSDDDVSWFKNTMDSITDPQARAGDNKLYIPRGDLGEQVKNLILEKINPWFPNKEIHTVNFYDITKAYGMHSDTVKYTMQGIVPLEFIDGDAYTLIYDQTSDT